MHDVPFVDRRPGRHREALRECRSTSSSACCSRCDAAPRRQPDAPIVTVVVTPPGGQPLSGALVAEDDFFVTVRDSSNTVRVVRRTPGMKVVKTDPLREHQLLLDRITDKDIHDLVAYLEKLK